MFQVAALLATSSPRRGLVIGCGSGSEVVELMQLTPATMIGIDQNPAFAQEAAAIADLRVADALALPFPDKHFDFAVCHHVLEHLGNPGQAVAEAARVLGPGSLLYIGVPNRARLLGYLGSADFTLGQKLHANFEDTIARLRGRFHNELGAHAGFNEQELRYLCTPHFSRFELLTREFLLLKYGHRVPSWLLRRMTGRLLDRVAPSHYAACWK